MSENLIKKYSTSVIKDFIERANDLKELKHKLTKGELKELFISRVLKSFLPSQFDIGSGIVVNGVAEQSRQTDIKKRRGHILNIHYSLSHPVVTHDS